MTAIYLLLPCTLYAQSQTGSTAVEESSKPNASKGQGGSGVTNVDLYTGTASVNIPIHDFVINELSAGVSLSYVAKGVRVDELSSSVGLGWQLNAGGSITREVFGIEDEVTLPAYFKNGAVTYPQHDSNTFDWLQGRWAPDANASPAPYDVNKDDQEYDRFHVNLLGRSFAFSMKRNTSYPYELQAYVKPHNEVKIELTSEDWNPMLTQVLSSSSDVVAERCGWNHYQGIIKFKITDEKGNQFFFERGDYRYKEYKVDGDYLFNNHEGHYYATEKWNLVRVLTYSGKNIYFIYDDTYVKILENITETFYDDKGPILDYNTNTVVFDPLEIKEQYWEGVKTHLKEIQYPNGTKVYFDISSDTALANTSRTDCIGAWLLKSIKIEQQYNSNVTKALTFKLKHAYFNTPKFGNSDLELPYIIHRNLVTYGITFPSNEARDLHHSRGLRLMLKGIEKVGFDNTSTEPYYNFGYMDIALPYRFSPQKDYYGYYNGKTSTPFIREKFFTPLQYDTFYLSIPYHTGTGGTWGIDRSHDHNYAHACVLNEVINAYGGKEILSFQNYSLSNKSCGYGYHEVTKCGINTVIGCDIDPDLEGSTVNDGLCIGSIQRINGYDATHGIKIEYTLDSGQRFYQGGYTWYKDNYGDITRTNFFVDPHDYYNGSNHGFSSVKVKEIGNFGTVTISERVYRFSNLMQYDASYPYNNNMKSCLFRPTSMDYRTMPARLDKHKMGLVLETKEYDKNGVLLSKHENSYTEKYDTGPYASTHWVYTVRFFDGPCWPGAASFGHYIIDDKRMLLTSEKHTRYLHVLNSSVHNEVTTTYNYYYDDYDNVKLVTWNDSKGDLYKKYKRYNYNFHYMYFGSLETQAMTDLGMQFLLSQEVWKMLPSSDSMLIDYNLVVPDGSFNFSTFFSLVNNEPVSSTDAGTLIGPGTSAIKVVNALHHTATNDYGTRLLKRKQYTNSNGPEVYESRVNDQDLFTSNIYDAHNNIVAKAINAKLDDIAFSSFEATNGHWIYNGANVVYTPGNAMTGSHVFNLIYNTNDIKSYALLDKDYIVAFWANSTATPQAEIINPSGTAPVTLTLQNTVGSWKLYTTTISPESTGVFRLYNPSSGTQMYIDEMRLHPSGAFFESFTYSPLCGITSSSNNGNYITYTEYDVFGRLVISRDMRGNILSKLEQFAQDDDNESTGGSGGQQGGGGGQ